MLLGLHLRLCRQHMVLKGREQWRGDAAGLDSNDLTGNTDCEQRVDKTPIIVLN